MKFTPEYSAYVCVCVRALVKFTPEYSAYMYDTFCVCVCELVCVCVCARVRVEFLYVSNGKAPMLTRTFPALQLGASACSYDMTTGGPGYRILEARISRVSVAEA